MPPQALNQIGDFRVLMKAFQVCSQALPNVGANQWLIAGETKSWGNIFQIINHIFRNPQANGRHHTVFL